MMKMILILIFSMFNSGKN